MIDKELYHIFETPNAVMRTLASPSAGSKELAVWTVEMRAGQAGPEHTADREQVWVVLEGTLAVNGTEVRAGAAVVVPAGMERRVTAPEAARALVASLGGASVTTSEGTRPLPWAA
jgi:quercetin dioxygenase-like cupin family protein